MNFSNIVFWHIGVQDVDRSIGNDDETIKGTRKLHSIKTKEYQNVFAFDKIKYSCFFHFCIDDTKSNYICENNMYVKYWKHTKLNTKGKMSVANFEEMQSEETILSFEGDQVSNLGNVTFQFL